MLNSVTTQSGGGGGGSPTFEGVYYVSEDGTGNGLATTTPMSYDTFFSTPLPDNTVVKFERV